MERTNNFFFSLEYLYETGYAAKGKMIAVTQPRRIAATTLAARVAVETGTRLGDVVGYSIRFDDLWTPGRTCVKFMTEGILVRELLADPLLKHYSVVMVDEVHERTLFTDVVMGLLRKVRHLSRGYPTNFEEGYSID